MLLSLVKESEFEAILNGPLSLTLGEKHFILYTSFAPYFPAGLNRAI